MTTKTDTITVTVRYAATDESHTEHVYSWTGPRAAAIERGAEELDAVKLANGRYAYYADETSSVWSTTASSLAELGGAMIDSEAEGNARGDIHSLWCAGDFDGVELLEDEIEAHKLGAGEAGDFEMVSTCTRALGGDSEALVSCAGFIAEAAVAKAERDAEDKAARS